MKVIKSKDEMSNISDLERANGKCIRLIPTMGALHRGHAFLIEKAFANVITNQTNPGSVKKSTTGQINERDLIVIVSIFVNPLQFNNADDFLRYPNTLQADLDICVKLNVDYVFVPDLDQMYPDIKSGANQCMVSLVGHLADTLEGKSRPGHFRGMLTVVCKLFNIIKPHEAYFGEKDYQQLLLVTKMSRDLSMGSRIVPVQTVRDEDMLPLSSRNVRLTHQQRQVAPVMYRLLLDAKEAIESHHGRSLSDYLGHNPANFESILAASMIATLSLNCISDEEIKVDYLELRCAKDLSELSYNHDIGCFDCENRCRMQQVTGDSAGIFKARLLISLIVGDVRLLDNIEVLIKI